MGSSATGRSGLFLALCAIAVLLSGCGDGSTGSSSGDAASASTSSASGNSSADSVSSTEIVALSSSAYSVAPSSTAVLTINRSGSSAGVVTVGYSTVNGTATAGTDFIATSGTVTWADGDSSAKTVLVPITSQASGTYFAFALTSVQGSANFGTPATATIDVNAATASTGSSSSGASSSSGGSSSGSSSSSTDSVTLSWSAPTDNTNGTALTNLAGYNIYYGTNSTDLSQKVSLTTVGLLTYVVTNLNSGTWFFYITSVNTAGTESSPSAVVSASI
jgi:hypothetical protein